MPIAKVMAAINSNAKTVMYAAVRVINPPPAKNGTILSLGVCLIRYQYPAATATHNKPTKNAGKYTNHHPQTITSRKQLRLTQ
jgi:hypothetical protein